MTLVKEYGLSVIWLALFCSLVVMMANHLHQIYIPNSPMDEEAGILKEVKPLVPSGSQVSFATNLSGDEASQGAYYQTQVGWCPGVLSDDASQADYILLYRSAEVKDSAMPFLVHCDTLYRRSVGAYTLMLLQKPKNKH